MKQEKPKLDYASPKHDDNRSTRLVLKGLLGAVVGFVLTVAGVKIFATFNPVRGTIGELALVVELVFAGIVVGTICGVIWGIIRENGRRS
jgi:hypothetical protein